jgi:hypothetical protein
MAETLTIRTASSTEVIQIASVGPQGPKGDKGDPGDVAGLPLTTQGDTLYRGAAANERLAIGTAGQVLKVSSGGIPEWDAESGAVSSVAGRTGAVTLAVADVADAVATSDARLSDARTPSSTLAHAASHHTGGADALAPNNIGAAWALVLSQQSITGNTVLAAGRNRRITLLAVGVTANVDLPHDNNQAGDVVTLFGSFSVVSTLSIRRAIVMNAGAPIAYSTVATLTASGQSFTFVSDGTPTGWSLRAVDTHTHTGAQVNVGTTANLPLKTGTNGVIEAGAFGTSAASFCEGNDARLSDDRDPNLHAASHAAAGSDPVFDQDLGTTDAVTFNSVTAGDNSFDGEGLKFDGELKFSPEEGNFYASGGIVFGASESAAIFNVPIELGGINAATNVATTRTNLGLGTAAVEATTAFAASGSITTSGLTQATARILGRTTASTGAVEEIQIGSGLSLSAGELSSTVSAGIPATILDAKGDLIVASAADTAARLAVGGTNGHVLTVDSAETLGVKWAAAAGGATTQTDIYTANGTWTKPAGAKMLQVELVGGGGGGGGGRRGAASTARGGGGGGAGAGRTVLWLHPDNLGATETVTVGAGGTGGTAAGDDTDGGTGGNGGDTTFGPLNAFGGNGGNGGNATAVATGGASAANRGFVLTLVNATLAGGAGGYEGSAAGTGGGHSATGGTQPAGGGGGSRITSANVVQNSGGGGSLFAGSGGINPYLVLGGAAPAAGDKGNVGGRLGFIGAGASGGRQGSSGEGAEGGDSILGAGGGGGAGATNAAGGSNAGGLGGNGIAVITTYF